MKYGFTPGMGATYILPYKIGASLSSEMLFTAENYRGVELQNRGIPFKVTERNNVLNEALNQAINSASGLETISKLSPNSSMSLLIS